MSVPTTEFRQLDITGTEPANRVTSGAVVSASVDLDLGTANITSGVVTLGPFCVIYRCSNLQGNAKIENMKAAVSAVSALNSNAIVYMDITNTWTQNKTVAQVLAGTPGEAPTSYPSTANLTNIDGGDIEGIAHADTSQYIYIVVQIAADESVGEDKGGSAGTLSIGVRADYA